MQGSWTRVAKKAARTRQLELGEDQIARAVVCNQPPLSSLLAFLHFLTFHEGDDPVNTCVFVQFSSFRQRKIGRVDSLPMRFL